MRRLRPDEDQPLYWPAFVDVMAALLVVSLIGTSAVQEEKERLRKLAAEQGKKIRILEDRLKKLVSEKPPKSEKDIREFRVARVRIRLASQKDELRRLLRDKVSDPVGTIVWMPLGSVEPTLDAGTAASIVSQALTSRIEDIIASDLEKKLTKCCELSLVSLTLQGISDPNDAQYVGRVMQPAIESGGRALGRERAAAFSGATKCFKSNTSPRFELLLGFSLTDTAAKQAEVDLGEGKEP